MNTDWAFYRGDIKDGCATELADSNWIPVVLPHIMQLEKKHCGGNSIYDGVGWYRRCFTVPESYRDKRVTVSFEGVMNACTVYLNGDSLYSHHGGYVGFTLDLSRALRYGSENVLALRVSAEYDPLTPPGKPQERMDFYYYSGIYRDVTLRVTDQLHITDPLEEDIVAGGGVFVTYPKADREEALVAVSAHVGNDSRFDRSGNLEVVLRNAEGKSVAQTCVPFHLLAGGQTTLKTDLSLDAPHLWFPNDPYRYELECRVVENGRWWI